jgi:hypothetical protein
MRQVLVLAEGESIRWEARPAPRCYTFRHWRHAIFGGIFLAITLCWQVLGFEMAANYTTAWMAWLPAPFVLIGLYLSVGHLFQARLEWNLVRYVITDRRLLLQRGLLKPWVESMMLSEMTYFRLDRHGDELGTLRVHKGSEQQLVLHCIEYPCQATALLEAAILQGHRTRDEERGQADMCQPSEVADA